MGRIQRTLDPGQQLVIASSEAVRCRVIARPCAKANQTDEQQPAVDIGEPEPPAVALVKPEEQQISAMERVIPPRPVQLAPGQSCELDLDASHSFLVKVATCGAVDPGVGGSAGGSIEVPEPRILEELTHHSTVAAEVRAPG